MRAAHRDMVETLRPYRDQLPGGVFHCFGGTAEEAEELIELFPTVGGPWRLPGFTTMELRTTDKSHH